MKNNGHKNPFRQNSRKQIEQREFKAAPYKKKAFGQHFLRKQSVVDHMIEKVIVTPDHSVMEIGCGDGFLTKAILEQTKCKKLMIYEIDVEWANYIKEKIKDSRILVLNQDVLQADLQALVPQKPWVLLANLPYQITFPILYLLQKNKELFTEGVIMVQEEVAQKIVATRGKKYSATTMFLQYHFDWKLLDKVEPGSFTPPPKVFSRTIYFKPKFDLVHIPRETEFWEFVKICFKAPRQTIRNNLKNTKFFQNEKITNDILQLRSQQISFDKFLELWNILIG